jgi:zinc/manganese transport system substrate-binding protein
LMMEGAVRCSRLVGTIGILALVVLAPSPRGTAQTKVRVVATLTNYGFVAQFIGGPYVDVVSIADGTEDPHFVKPKPSYAVLVQNADLFISTGLDLELWEPALLAKAGNARIMPGSPGYVSASAGIPLLEVPAVASRAEGDIHIYGNPHIYTSPWLMKRIAANIAAGLIRVDPAHRDTYEHNLQHFRDEVDRRLFGDTLVRMFGGDLLDRLVESGQLMTFLRSKTYQGRPLMDHLGGWLKDGLVFRDRKVVCYHKDWIYFATLFGQQIVDYIEPKPGIPPTPQHVANVVERMRRENVRVLIAAVYFDQAKVRTIAERVGAVPVIIPMGVTAQFPTYWDVVDFWVRSIAEAFQRAGGAGARWPAPPLRFVDFGSSR